MRRFVATLGLFACLFAPLARSLFAGVDVVSFVVVRGVNREFGTSRNPTFHDGGGCGTYVHQRVASGHDDKSRHKRWDGSDSDRARYTIKRSCI